eukprot:TRINITY_DN386_c0_g1_i1.p1 TRINITY_DN386_c0_g1~~TRINITY_DN386_c0_g1_i1.p1  ORF type:complete len:363 (+),score=78.19 TRINITY_DN386_c0_g1_i1:56-1144(+)
MQVYQTPLKNVQEISSKIPKRLKVAEKKLPEYRNAYINDLKKYSESLCETNTSFNNVEEIKASSKKFCNCQQQLITLGEKLFLNSSQIPCIDLSIEIDCKLDNEQINTALAYHFASQGFWNFSKNLESVKVDNYKDLYYFIDEFNKTNNAFKLLNYLVDNKETFNNCFVWLIKHSFYKYYMEKNFPKCIETVQKHIQHVHESRKLDIYKLLSLMSFVELEPEDFPKSYSSLIREMNNLSQIKSIICSNFSTIFAQINDLPTQSHLKTSFSVGRRSYPLLAKVLHMQKDHPSDTFNALSLNLPSNTCCHSVICCPVERGMINKGEACVLSCGHVCGKQNVRDLDSCPCCMKRLRNSPVIIKNM